MVSHEEGGWHPIEGALVLVVVLRAKPPGKPKPVLGVPLFVVALAGNQNCKSETKARCGGGSPKNDTLLGGAGLK